MGVSGHGRNSRFGVTHALCSGVRF